MEVFSFPFKAMGSLCELRLYADDSQHAESVAQAARDYLETLEARYSRYRPESLLSRINASAGTGKSVEVDDETAGLLNYALTAHQQSGGLFDVTSGVLRRVWDFKSGRLPSQADIDAVLPLIGAANIAWNPPHVALPEKGMEIDFGGYVKEYAADSTANLCRARGIAHGLVDLGGDITVIGPHPDGGAWQVGVRNPRDPEKAIATVELSSGAIASSGDYERFMEVKGRRYCHILNPLTGWPVEGLQAVSVLSEQCLIAGTASTIAMLKGAEDGLRWLGDLGLAYVCVTRDGEVISS